ncbi:Protein MCM10 homolog, partial [Linum perenne]
LFSKSISLNFFGFCPPNKRKASSFPRQTIHRAKFTQQISLLRRHFCKSSQALRDLTMSTHEEELDLLLSLQDPDNETPPGSPSNPTFDSPGFLSDDDGSPRRRGKTADLSVFKDAVRDCLDYDVNKIVEKSRNSNQLSKKSSEVIVEKYSGLRIRKSMVDGSISGSWATVGVLTEKGNPRTSSVGKSYSIWKLSCLDENTVSVFLFGDAYKLNSGEKAGTVFGLFNCAIRKDNMVGFVVIADGNWVVMLHSCGSMHYENFVLVILFWQGSGFSLSVFSPNQILKMGTSADYGVCKGERKGGIACSLIVNKRKGIYCKFHNVKSAERFSTSRSKLKGGNLNTAFRTPINSRGIYMVDPLADKNNSKKPTQPMKLLSVEGLRKALSNGEKVTTNTHSQGMRFLNEVAGKLNPRNWSKASGTASQHTTSLDKRKLQSMKVNPPGGQTTAVQDDSKRRKTTPGAEKMIELDLIDSDEEL